MAAPYNPPVKNQDFIVYITVEDFSSAGSFRVNPTIEAGDFQVSIDDAAFANPATLPTVSPAGSRWIKVVLSAAEMNGDVIKFQGVDQSTSKEWADFALPIVTTSP